MLLPMLELCCVYVLYIHSNVIALCVTCMLLASLGRVTYVTRNNVRRVQFVIVATTRVNNTPAALT
jgi:hypothetical protein